MDFLTLKQLVRQGEGQYVEFKLKANHPEKIVREMIAFANSQGGGWLLLGVDDDRTIKGVKYPYEDEYVMSKAIAEYAYPVLKYRLVRVSLEEYKEREVLAFYIPKSKEVSYFKESDNEKYGKAYIRVKDKCLKASYEMWEILKRQAKQSGTPFQYGEKERVLLQYLANNKQITVEEFSRNAQISRTMASRCLVTLVVAKVITIYPQENGVDYFQYNLDNLVE